MRFEKAFSLLLAGAVLICGCGERPGQGGAVEVAVTNSYLASAAWDLCGEDLQILSLAPPGMCPGHFDISPSQVSDLCKSRLLLLFSFQTQIEESLARVKERGVKTAFVKSPGGLCLPAAYRDVCAQVREILSRECPDRLEAMAGRQSLLEAEISSLESELPELVSQAGLAGAEVLASHRQAEFARWLGLEVVAEFVGSDTETVSNIDACLSKAKGRNIRFVIANRQEGSGLAEALAARLDARAVAFSNFPKLLDGPGGYAELVRTNVSTLIEVAQ